MKILIAGGTGFIGGRLLSGLLEDGHSVTLLTRDPVQAGGWSARGAAVLSWKEGGLPSALEDADAVVNLAGAGVGDARWTASRKELILKSRIEPTRALVDAMAKAKRRPLVLVNASAVGFYGPRGSEEIDESAPRGAGFLAGVCQQWETEALRARQSGARVALLRFGVVLGRGGGALARIVPPFRLGLGGRLGPGTQWFPWVHLDDAAGLARHAVVHPACEGPVNAVAPQSVTNADFTAALGRVLGRPTVAAVPEFGLRLMFGEMSEMLLTGQRVVPRAAERAGYRFRFPDLAGALSDILDD